MAYLFLFLGDCPHQRELLQVLWLHEGEIGGQALLVKLHTMRHFPREARGARFGSLSLRAALPPCVLHSSCPGALVRRIRHGTTLGTRSHLQLGVARGSAAALQLSCNVL